MPPPPGQHAELTLPPAAPPPASGVGPAQAAAARGLLSGRRGWERRSQQRTDGRTRPLADFQAAIPPFRKLDRTKGKPQLSGSVRRWRPAHGGRALAAAAAIERTSGIKGTERFPGKGGHRRFGVPGDTRGRAERPGRRVRGRRRGPVRTARAHRLADCGRGRRAAAFKETSTT